MDVTVPSIAVPEDPRPSNPGIDSGDAIIRIDDVFRIYREADVETVALRGIDLAIAPGEFVAVMGRSGSGKSTLLNLLAGSDRPTAGRVIVAGIDLARADEAERHGFRGRRIGIVYQSQNLVPMLSLVENVALAACLARRPMARPEIETRLAMLGLGGRGDHRPDQLSGGEQQRAALACVLAADPPILLADEITGELDFLTAAAVLDAVTTIHRAAGTTVVLVTHDPAVAARSDRVVQLRDGRIVSDRRLT
ncbi:MAG: ABC transporter ATP-binding protein [Candidatus Limnocylindrales bacterium]